MAEPTHPINNRTKVLVYMALFVALIAVCAWISIPFTVPFTLQTFAIFAAVGLLGGKRATLTVLVYLLLGAIGIPIFSGFSGGFGRLLGTTGGYLIGFIFSCVVSGLILHKWGRSIFVMAIAMFSGLIVCYAFGTAWFLWVYARTTGPIGLAAALSWCVVPFLIPDAVKIALAIFMTKRLEPYVQLSSIKKG
ncbi:MAG: biotin transporter BioY [Clostridia bacterium]